MGHQNAHYLKLKGNTYYFSRRVPKRLQRHCSRDRIEVCLHTSSRHHAVRQSAILSSQLEDQWTILRKRDLSQCLWKYFETEQRVTSAKGPSIADASEANSPRLSEATKTYVSMKALLSDTGLRLSEALTLDTVYAFLFFAKTVGEGAVWQALTTSIPP